ncbi:MAG: sulfite exporter TauE/SafE family protein [Clostridia bacterium]|nr:sulfite exporter TauE/SafE family protein [Clostridia bacterium]
MYIVSGLAAGLLAGMGMGGGTILIPALTLLAGTAQHAAQGINMLAFLPASILAIIVHIREGRLHLKRCVPLLVGGGIGAAAGSFLAMGISAGWLRRLFGIFLMAFSVYQLISRERKQKTNQHGGGE